MATGHHRILASAFRLFSERGFDAVSIRDIAEGAGLSNPALYRHYASKSELGFEVYRRAYDAVLGAVEARITSDMDGLEKLDAYLEACVGVHRMKPSPLILLDELQNTFWPQIRDTYGERVLSAMIPRWIEEAQTQGAVRRDYSPVMLSTVVIGALSQWASLTSFDLVPRTGAADALQTLVRSALQAPPPPPQETGSR